MELVHRGGVEVRSVAPGRQQQVERTLVVVVAELDRHPVIGGRFPVRAVLCRPRFQQTNQLLMYRVVGFL